MSGCDLWGWWCVWLSSMWSLGSPSARGRGPYGTCCLNMCLCLCAKPAADCECRVKSALSPVIVRHLIKINILIYLQISCFFLYFSFLLVLRSKSRGRRCRTGAFRHNLPQFDMRFLTLCFFGFWLLVCNTKHNTTHKAEWWNTKKH